LTVVSHCNLSLQCTWYWAESLPCICTRRLSHSPLIACHSRAHVHCGMRVEESVEDIAMLKYCDIVTVNCCSVVYGFLSALYCNPIKLF
jgi:hypothetical protein